MKRHKAAFVVLLGAAMVRAHSSAINAQPTPAPAPSSSSRDIDRDVWNVIIETVERDDIVRMGSTYGPHAVLVTPRGTQPIAAALDRWGRDMATNKAKGVKATVAFRFTLRQDGVTTAFETGIFKYTTVDAAGVSQAGYYPFENLLVKIDGRWRILMERQLGAVTAVEWAKLTSSPSS